MVSGTGLAEVRLMDGLVDESSLIIYDLSFVLRTLLGLSDRLKIVHGVCLNG